ncbi:MAG TPA: PKD domain-containing protein, partial [Saprospiraceae bacterium]|nr:PKD domain-containing protein [Saprospiraceae bacterium]
IAIGVDSIAWDFGDGTQGLGADIIHEYAIEGNYTVCEYVFNECGVDTFCRDLVLVTNAVVSLEENYQLQLSPNPSQDHCILSIDMPLAAHVAYRLFSASGRNIFERSAFMGAGKQSIFMETKNLPTGNYFLVVTVNGKSATLPLIR